MRKLKVVVEPRSDGRWAVQTDSSQRAASVHDLKHDAISHGRVIAENKRAELVIINEMGASPELSPASSLTEQRSDLFQ